MPVFWKLRFEPSPSFRMEALNNTHEFLGEVAGAKFRYWVLKLDKQLLIHISHSNDNPFTDLAVSMPGGQATTTILGAEMDSNGSERLAAKLAKKLNKQVFISCNVVEDRLGSPAIEKRLVEEIQARPEFF